MVESRIRIPRVVHLNWAFEKLKVLAWIRAAKGYRKRMGRLNRIFRRDEAVRRARRGHVVAEDRGRTGRAGDDGVGRVSVSVGSTEPLGHRQAIHLEILADTFRAVALRQRSIT